LLKPEKRLAAGAMVKRSKSSRRSRAIVAFDCQAHTALAVEITHYAATVTSSGLLGVLVDAVELLDHAQSSLAREVLYSGAQRPLETVALGRQIRARSRLAQNEFESAAKKLGLAHEFRSSDGNVLARLAEWVSESQALVATVAADSVAMRTAWKSAMHDLSAASIRTLLFAREGWRIGTGILAVIDDITQADATLRIARRFVRGSHSPLFLALSNDSTNDNQAAEALIAKERTRLSMPVRVVTAPDVTGPQTIADAIRQTHARIVILPWKLTEKSPNLLETLLTATNASVALVR
jgi:hypothetical protein